LGSTVVDAWYWQTENYNPNLIYDFSSPTNDPWRAETLATFGSSSKTIEFPLDELASFVQEEMSLSINLAGGIDYQQVPEQYPNNPNRCGASHLDFYPGMPNDHCLRVKINNVAYEDLVFDGLTVLNQNYTLDSSSAATGSIKVQLDLSGETGFDYDIVNIENISIKYPRNLTAINDNLQFVLADSSAINSDYIYDSGFDSNANNDSSNQILHNKASIVIDGFSNNSVIAYALNGGVPKRINNVKVSPSSLGFKVQIPTISPNDDYWLSTEQSLIKPLLEAWHQTQTLDSTHSEYLIIAHPDFIQTSMQLKNYHENNGMSVELVNVKDIYVTYSKSVVDPLAIKKFIKNYANDGILQYVLLVGSDNYDYKGYLSETHFSHIPSIYTAIDDVVRFAPSDSLFADTDEDGVPDLAIGRLPARTVEELQLLIDKQMVYVNQQNQNLSTQFIADASDNNYSYAQISQELSDLIPPSWSRLTAYRDNFINAESTKQQILTNFSTSPRLTTYLGHSGPRNWFAFPSAFTYNDIASINNEASASVILQWGCWNSYYVEPDANTMAHRFLFDSDKGGVAVFGATALTSVLSEKAFARLIIPEMVKQNQSIGLSMLQAKRALSTQGNYRDVIIGWNLLGDPALKLTN
jgi:hypothetical protein